MHWIVGAGGVGIGLGATLLAAGEPVTFVARGETAESLRRTGCVRSGLFGRVEHAPGSFGVAASAGRIVESPRAVWIATKTPAVGGVSQELARLEVIRDGDAPLLMTQNGLGSAETAADWLPRSRVFNASVITGFARRGPGEVAVTAHADPIRMGSLFGADPTPLLPLADALSRGGIPAEVTHDVAAVLWAKALYNGALNPLSALLRVPYGRLGQNQRTRAIMRSVVEEIFAVIRASGSRTHWPDADAYLEHFYAALLPPTAAHESSMLQDVRAGRPTEIDALCGEIARRGAAAGVATPVNEALAVLVRAIADG